MFACEVSCSSICVYVDALSCLYSRVWSAGQGLTSNVMLGCMQYFAALS